MSAFGMAGKRIRFAPNGCIIAYPGACLQNPDDLRAEGELLFELDAEPLGENLTAYAGIPLFVQAMRSLEVAASVKQHLALKQRQRGFDKARMWRVSWCGTHWVGIVSRIGALARGRRFNNRSSVMK